jgi:deoxyadenosine/deoxycytidine kinase
MKSRFKHLVVSGCSFTHEPVNDWNDITDSNGINILTKYYSNQSKYAFSFQMLAFITRLKQISEVIETYKNTDVIIVTERCIYTDREIFAKMLYDFDKIEYIEYKIYMKWFDYFVKDIKIYGIIYLKTFPSVCLERIKIRNRPGEDINIDYLNTLHHYHQEWLINKEDNILHLDGSSQFSDLVYKFDYYIQELNESDIESESEDCVSDNYKYFFYYFFIILNFIIVIIPFVYPYISFGSINNSLESQTDIPGIPEF